MSDPRAFMERYLEIFASYDRDALLDCFGHPLHVVSSMGDSTVITTAERDAWEGVIDGLLGAYRTLGVAGGEALTLDVDEPVAGAARVHAHWRLQREDGSAVYEFTSLYTLALVDGGLRIVAIAHDELPKLQAALAG